MDAYGPRGWWPLGEFRRHDPDHGGYHPGKYDSPSSASGRFEVGIGAILTQNTTWKQVAGCIDSLDAAGLLDPPAMIQAVAGEIEAAIRPSGYFRQKTRKLKEFAGFFLATDPVPPARKELLSVWGIGEETGDSILLYAYGRPVFVVDDYTRRLVARMTGGEAPGYAGLQENLSAAFRDLEARERARVFNEFHALVVHLGKAHCRRRPDCPGCPLEGVCRYAKRP